MSNRNRGLSIDASYHVSVHLAKRFRGEESKKSANQKLESPVVAIFIEDLPQMLPTKFQTIWPSDLRGEDFQKSTNQKQELPVAAMFVNGSRRNEHSLQRTAHRCFLPSFGSFGQTVSDEKNFKISHSETRVACGDHVC